MIAPFIGGQKRAIPGGTRPARGPACGFLAVGFALILGIAACAPTSGNDGEFEPVKTTNTDFTVTLVDTGLRPIFLDAADLDGDGTVDAVTANRFDDTVSVLTAGFTTEDTIAVGAQPTDVLIGDLDALNDLDIVVLSEFGTRLSVFLSAPAGGWTATHWDLLDTATQVTLADLNGDGSATQDIVVTVTTGNAVWGFVNDGSGVFTTVVSDTLVGPQRFVSGDWDGDLDLDLAVLHPRFDLVSILIGNGAGGFSVSPSDGIDLRDNPTHITTADLNGDGNPDLAVSNQNTSRVSVVLGSASGVFSVLDHYRVKGSPGALVAGVFDDDSGVGADDLAIVNRQKRAVSILTQKTDSVDYRFQFERITKDPVGLVVGDFNLDGDDDILVAEDDDRAISILAGNRTGTFTRTAIGLTSSPSFPVSVDLGGNGTGDVLLLQPLSSRLVILENVH